MKTKLPLLAIFALFAFNVNAQSDYSSYLNKALEKLEAGDCESDQKYYNVYKDLSGESKSSIEELIQDCITKAQKSYTIGDKIIVDNKIYKVAYIEDGGKHGFAVCENGSGKKPENSVIPTWAEFKLIEKNNKILKLCGKYYYTYGLGGRGNESSCRSDQTYDILLIYRF